MEKEEHAAELDINAAIIEMINIGVREESVFDEIKSKFNVANLEELKELINQAQNQIDQFNETLEKIKTFKIQVS
ncbi:hypothetical protein ACFC90_07515 [Enterococcus casseliflavus]|uniref:hypothetical protein n=1 Tax=Enterococcus casseliflavus TaxID=37734 RepID=UPI0039A4F58F